MSLARFPGEIEQRLASLEYQLRMVEARLLTALTKRDLVWLELAAKAMRILTSMIAEAIPYRRYRRESAMDQAGELPIPDLEGRAINVEEYRVNTPEKLELLYGYLIDGPGPSDSRRRLLALLLVNEGLREAVRLAPEDRWREALESIHKT
jgi:hypothetical protein